MTVSMDNRDLPSPGAGQDPERGSVAVIAASVHHGNTLRVARTIADELNADLLTPEQLDPEEEWQGLLRRSGRSFTIERDADKAVAGADLIFADTWVSMHDAQSARERRHNMLRPYQVNEALMAHAKPDSLFMHCLPAHRDEEATSAVMDGPHSVIFDEAENRLHAQKAIMRWCLGV